LSFVQLNTYSKK